MQDYDWQSFRDESEQSHVIFDFVNKNFVQSRQISEQDTVQLAEVTEPKIFQIESYRDQTASQIQAKTLPTFTTKLPNPSTFKLLDQNYFS